MGYALCCLCCRLELTMCCMDGSGSSRCSRHSEQLHPVQQQPAEQQHEQAFLQVNGPGYGLPH